LARDFSLLLAEAPSHAKNQALRGGGGRQEQDAVPPEVAAKMGQGHVEYTYDPAKPVLTRGGNNLVLMFVGFGCGSEDQRAHEAREDVKSFDSQVLDAPMAMTGKISAVLHVSTDVNATDFVVSLTDVHPDGHSMQIRSGLRRLKYRDSTPTKTVVSPVVANRVYRVEVNMWFTSYVVAKGHKLRVSVSSADTPYYAKNDNSGKSADALGLRYAVVAKNRVHWSPDLPSYVEIPLVSLDQLPRNDGF
jgi:putative CocE/NonD family hydrolase